MKFTKKTASFALAAASLAAGGSIATVATADASGTNVVKTAAPSCGAQADTVSVKSGTKMSPADLKMPSTAISPQLQSMINTNQIKWITDASCHNLGHKSHKIPARHKVSIKSSKSADYQSQNWSGYVANAGDKYTNYVSTSYNEPKTSSKSSVAMESIWVGLGGMDTKNPLIQDGTASIVQNGTASHVLWWEVYPYNNMTELNSIKVAAGDHVFVTSSYKSSTASFLMCNLTKKVCANVQMKNVPAPGNTAEWIVEKPTTDQGLLPLANYGSVTFSSNEFDMTTSNQPVHAAQYWSKSMDLVGDSGSVDATQTKFNGNSFTSMFKNAN